MSLKHNELVIDPDDPFKNCQLERKKYATVLTEIVNAYPEGFVLAINNKWGTGKTTFIKMWHQTLINENYRTVYLNAWENDFENNPLAAIISELKTLETKHNTSKFKKVVKKAATLSTHILPIVAKAVAEKYINTDSLKDSIADLTKEAATILENEISDYSKKKEGIIEFKNTLTDFIAKENDANPVVFIIDELDRCRPDYAVSVLEQIKHFFAVTGVTFVLCVDKSQLANAIRGVYGSDQIDAEEYLRRFIDIEYSIPEPDGTIFYKYLYTYFGFDDFLKSSKREAFPELRSDKEQFEKICIILFGNGEISLRQLEKIFAHSRLVLRSYKENSYLIPSVFIFLNYIKIVNPIFYDEIRSKRLTIVQLQDQFFDIIKDKKNGFNVIDLMVLEAYLILFYANYLSHPYERIKVYEWDNSTSKTQVNFPSKVNPSDKDRFSSIFDSFDRSRYSSLSLGSFIQKIDLLENLQT